MIVDWTKIERREPSSGCSWLWVCSASRSLFRLRALYLHCLRGFLCVLLVLTAMLAFFGEEAYLRGKVLFLTGHPMESGAFIEQAYRLFPLRMRIRETRALWVVLWSRVSRDEALAVLDEMLAEDTGLPRLRMLRRGLIRQRGVFIGEMSTQGYLAPLVPRKDSKMSPR